MIWILLVGTMALSLWAMWRVKSVYHRYSQGVVRSGLTGAEVAAEILRRYRQGRTPYALVSASQDGAWLTAFFSLMGLRAVRGSSSRLGREAASDLVEVMRAGYDIGITPDGPRGPCYVVQEGVISTAQLTGMPIVPDKQHLGRTVQRFYRAPGRFSRRPINLDR